VINFPKELFCDHPALSAFLASAEGKHGLYFPAEVLHNSLNGIFCNLDAARTLFEGAGHRQAKEGAMMQADLLRILLLLSLSEPKEAVGEVGNIIPRVIEYLNDHLEREISLDKLAQKFFVSKYYLCHAFRKHTGVSVFTYLSTKRIAMAEQLLAKGEPATSVAYQVGFQNYSSFYRSFCKLKGRAPVYSHGGAKEGSKL
jgi:AraC-like DNA-binding protein